MYICEKCMLRLLREKERLSYYWTKMLNEEKCDICKNITEIDYIRDEDYDRLEKKGEY